METQKPETPEDRLERIEREEREFFIAQKTALIRTVVEGMQAIEAKGLAETRAKATEKLSSKDPDERWSAQVVLDALNGKTRGTRRSLQNTLGKLWPGNWFQRG